ncbi:MAG: TIGR02300 family protein [Alphaproteobacteria bacterium]|nr:TIGR02300 family protein [Alphaproteobacteria bacterium]
MTDIRGLKRVCASCATRFYDFNKSPIICPKCKAEFTGIVKVRTRRGRNVIEEAKAKAAKEEDNTEVVAEDDTTVSLEDIENEENEDIEDDEAEGGDLDLDDLDDDDDDDEDEDLEDLDEDIEVEEKE